MALDKDWEYSEIKAVPEDVAIVQNTHTQLKALALHGNKEYIYFSLQPIEHIPGKEYL